MPRRAARWSGSHPPRGGVDARRRSVQRTTRPLSLEGNQKPMEGEDSEHTTATSIPGPDSPAEQSLEVGGEARERVSNGKRAGDLVTGSRCGGMGSFEGCTHTGDGAIILSEISLLAARSGSRPMLVGGERDLRIHVNQKRCEPCSVELQHARRGRGPQTAEVVRNHEGGSRSATRGGVRSPKHRKVLRFYSPEQETGPRPERRKRGALNEDGSSREANFDRTGNRTPRECGPPTRFERTFISGASRMTQSSGGALQCAMSKQHPLWRHRFREP